MNILPVILALCATFTVARVALLAFALVRLAREGRALSRLADTYLEHNEATDLSRRCPCEACLAWRRHCARGER